MNVKNESKRMALSIYCSPSFLANFKGVRPKLAVSSSPTYADLAWPGAVTFAGQSYELMSSVSLCLVAE